MATDELEYRPTERDPAACVGVEYAAQTMSGRFLDVGYQVRSILGQYMVR